jgi:hypothetical protein
MKSGISGPGKEQIFSRILAGGRCGKEIGAMRARIEAVEHFHWFERFLERFTATSMRVS